MSKLRIFEEENGIPKIVCFICPGCNEEHQVWVNGSRREGNSASWGFNGSMDKPTFTPSILIRSGHYAPGHNTSTCWCTYNEEHKEKPAPFQCMVCHTFVRDGKIQFLNDCTHHLAGQTVELPEINQ
jgi:hypothetical protein